MLNAAIEGGNVRAVLYMTKVHVRVNIFTIFRDSTSINLFLLRAEGSRGLQFESGGGTLDHTHTSGRSSPTQLGSGVSG